MNAMLTQIDVNEAVSQTLMVDHMGLPEHETHRHIHALDSLAVIRIQSRIIGSVDEIGRETF
jgi:hypothetical protein